MAYVVSDAVESGGSAYICIQPHVNQPPPNAAYWNLLAAQGASGAQGPTGPQGASGPAGLTWQGSWNAATAYVVSDAVESGGSSYVCVQANVNQSPPNPTYWSLLAAQGATGPQGPQGASGNNVGGIVFCATPQTTQAWNNMPLAQTELFGTTWVRRQADLTGMTQFRLTVNQSVAGAATAYLRAQYSTNGGTSWNNLESGGTTADLVVGAGTGLKVGTWANIDPAAGTDVQVRLVGANGDGTTDPAFRYIDLDFK